MQFCKTMHSFQCFIYFTEDKPKTDRGAVIETRCKQREKGRKKKVKKATKTRAGRKAENPGSNKRQITFRVTQFIFQMRSMVEGRGGRGRN